MTADHPLFSFMPYGAPELLRDGQRNLFRATILSSLVGVLALLFGSVLVRSIVDEMPPPRIIVDNDHVLTRVRETQRLAEPVMRAVAPARHSRFGIAVPVRDIDAPVEVTFDDPGAVVGHELGRSTHDIDTAEPGSVGGSDPTMPPIDEPIFVDEMPVPIVDPHPEYPGFAKDLGVEGMVLVHVFVDREGRVVEVRANPKRTVPLLESAALEAARRWVFRPAFSNGHPVAVWVAIPFEFRLH